MIEINNYVEEIFYAITNEVTNLLVHEKEGSIHERKNHIYP